MTSEHDAPAHYHDPTDRKYTANIRRAAPKAFAAWGEFDAAVFADEENGIPRKYKELMALAVGLTTQCVYCIESHSQAARKHGATDQELAETTMVTMALRAGGAIAHGRLAFKLAGPPVEVAADNPTLGSD